MKQMRLPMVAPVRPRIVSTKERKGEKNKHYTLRFWRAGTPTGTCSLVGNSVIIIAVIKPDEIISSHLSLAR